MPERRIGIREFRGNFSGFMRQVRQGSSFVVTSRDKVVALIQPPRPPLARLRQPGTLAGRAQAFELLPIEMAHLLCLGDLPTHHRDSFDHLLLSQAISEAVAFISADCHAPSYPVDVVT